MSLSIERVVLVCSKELGFITLKKMYESMPDKMVGLITFDDRNDSRSVFEQIVEFGSNHQIQVSILNKPSELKAVISALKPNLVFVIGWYWVIPPSVLILSTYGFFGLHASLLPSYRGFAPLVWSMLNGEGKTGVSLFQFDDGIDTGDLVGQIKITIADSDYIADLLKLVEVASISLLNNFLHDLSMNRLELHKQISESISYCSKREESDGAIDWTKTNVQIRNLIRAISKPYPGAFTYKNNERLTIWGCNLYENEYYGIPGLIVKVQETEAIVCCGRGAVIITSISQSGVVITDFRDVLKFGDRLSLIPGNHQKKFTNEN